MTAFFTDDDLAGSADFSEAELQVATEYTVISAGTATFRWRWPSTNPSVTPRIRVYNDAGTAIAGPLNFATSVLGEWNSATGTVDLTAGTYRASVNTTHYPAVAGFFTGGPVVRGQITGVQSRFGATGSAPSSTSTAAYFVDMDFTPTGDPDPDPDPEPNPEVVEEPRVGESLHLARVMDEAALALSQITGINVFAYPPASLTAPAGYLSYPDQIRYDQTYGRGQDDYIGLPIVLVVGVPTAKKTRDRVAAWSASDGPTSVKARMDAWQWTTCDYLAVDTCEFDVEVIGGVEYLACMFKATVTGAGKD